MERKCKYNGGQFCSGTTCNLDQQLEGQANRGGFPDTSLTRGSGVGPYFPRQTWENYVRRIKEAANQGCAHKLLVIKKADIITTQKELKGELIDRS